MRKKNLKPVITGSVLIIPVLLSSAGLNANAKSHLPKIHTGNLGVKAAMPKLNTSNPATKGLKNIANKIINNTQFKTSNPNVNNGNKTKYPVDRCNSISPNQTGNRGNNPTDAKNLANINKGKLNNNLSNINKNTNSTKTNNKTNEGPVYENVLTINTPSSNKNPQSTLSPKNRPLPPIPGSNSSGGSGKRPTYNPNKGKAPAPPTDVEPYRPGSTNNKNKLTLKQNNNGKQEPIYDEVPNDPIYEEIPGGNEPIYMNTGSFGDSIYDIPN